MHWQGVPVAGAAELDSMMKGAAAQAVQPEIHVRPNRLSKYEVVANVLASTKRLGLTKIGVIGSEQFVE